MSAAIVTPEREAAARHARKAIEHVLLAAGSPAGWIFLHEAPSSEGTRLGSLLGPGVSIPLLMHAAEALVAIVLKQEGVQPTTLLGEFTVRVAAAVAEEERRRTTSTATQAAAALIGH